MSPGTFFFIAFGVCVVMTGGCFARLYAYDSLRRVRAEQNRPVLAIETYYEGGWQTMTLLTGLCAIGFLIIAIVSTVVGAVT